MGSTPVTIGIIANPVSARDIRRVVANASNLQIADRVNIVLRLLTTLVSLGVERVLMMPDRGGIRAMLTRHVGREKNQHHQFPVLEFLPMEPTTTVQDTFLATRLLQQAEVAVIIVLGGDGTHRAVVKTLLQEGPLIPIAGLSTGTNNAFPDLREPTLTAMAVALYATGRIPAARALVHNKVLDVAINEGERQDIALVDAVISTERQVGARALWKTESLHSLYLTFADPQVIGLSAIGGLLQPIARTAPEGLMIELAPETPAPSSRTATAASSAPPAATAAPAVYLRAPIAPGMLRDVAIARWQRMPADLPFPVSLAGGVVALDGERELPFSSLDRVTLTLRQAVFTTVDVTQCLNEAASTGLFRHPLYS